jgi:hypothetical protein
MSIKIERSTDWHLLKQWTLPQVHFFVCSSLHFCPSQKRGSSSFVQARSALPRGLIPHYKYKYARVSPDQGYLCLFCRMVSEALARKLPGSDGLFLISDCHIRICACMPGRDHASTFSLREFRKIRPRRVLFCCHACRLQTPVTHIAHDPSLYTLSISMAKYSTHCTRIRTATSAAVPLRRTPLPLWTAMP